MAMDSGMQSGMFQAAYQGAQNTSKQELAQRQALFQNLVAATDDSAWISSHFPGFANWTPTGGGTGSYQPGANAPLMAVGGNASLNIPANNSGQNNNQQAQADYYKYLIEKDKKLGTPDNSGNTSNATNSYSNLWS